MSFTKGQIEMLQEFIDAQLPGVYDAMDIIPEGYKEYFDVPTKHGPVFKRAVLSRRKVFRNIEHMPPVEGGNNHQRYKLHGG